MQCFLRGVKARLCLTLLASGLALPLHAANPASGLLTPQSPNLSFTAGPFFVANPGGRVLGEGCFAETTSCDVYALEVELPEGYAQAHPNDELLAELDWPLEQADFDLIAVDGNGVPTSYSTSSAKPESLLLPLVPGRRSFQLQIFPSIPLGQSVTGRVSLRTVPPTPSPTAAGAPPRFQVYRAPAGTGVFAGEPTLDVNLRTNTPLFLAFLETLKLTFDDRTSPARTTWTNVSAESTRCSSQDPILTTDPTTGRSFVIQLQLASSVIAYTDDDGTSWTTGAGPGQPHGIDHPSLGAGPYPAGLGLLRRGSYPNAVYYCSHALLFASCSRSDDGGLSFAPAVPIHTGAQCEGAHGFVAVAPDGTVYVPKQACDNAQGFALSEDAGATWTVRTISGVRSAIGSQPAIAFDVAGTLYFGYQASDGRSRVRVSSDKGLIWRHDQDIGARLGIKNSVFHSMIAGDAGRAALAFLGTDAVGNYQATDFTGTWYLYIAITYDGGESWQLVNATPGDPVQGPGGVCVAGIICTGNRNLYDFNDIAADAQGRVLAAYADGCIGACERAGHSSFSSTAAFVRQSGGRGLSARFDPVAATRPGAPLLSATRYTQGVQLEWPATDDGGSAIRQYRVYRAIGDAPLRRLVEVGISTRYADRAATHPALSYRYAISAANALGEGSLGNEVRPEPASDPHAACTAPGVTVFSDRLDANLAPANPQIDVRGLSVAEPQDQSDQVVFTLELEQLPPELPAGHHWQINFDTPDGERYYLSADTLDAPLATYAYGRFGTPQDQSAAVPLGQPDTALVDGNRLVFSIAKDKLGITADAEGALDGILVQAYLGDKRSVFDDAGPGLYKLRGPCLANATVDEPDKRTAADKGRFGGSTGGLIPLLALAALRRRRLGRQPLAVLRK